MGTNSDDSEATHFAHYAHRVHIMLETVHHALHSAHEKSARLAHVESAHLAYVEGASKLVKAHGQMARNLSLMRRTIIKVENMAKEGGTRGAAAKLKLPIVKEEYRLAKFAFERERNVVAYASEILEDSKLAAKAQAAARVSIDKRLGTRLRQFEQALKSSPLGSRLLKTGKIVVSEPVLRALIVFGVTLDVLGKYLESHAQSVEFRAAEAALHGAVSYMVMKVPVLAAMDVLLDVGGMGHLKPSLLLRAAATGVPAIVEGLATKDTTAMRHADQAFKSGKFGPHIQQASEIGDATDDTIVYWAEKGIVDGIWDFASAIKNL